MTPENEENLKAIINDLYNCIDGLLKRTDLLESEIQSLYRQFYDLKNKDNP